MARPKRLKLKEEEGEGEISYNKLQRIPDCVQQCLPLPVTGWVKLFNSLIQCCRFHQFPGTRI
jgi:hypothetical protein